MSTCQFRLDGADYRQAYAPSSQLFELGFIVPSVSETHSGPGVSGHSYDVISDLMAWDWAQWDPGVGHTPGVTRTCEGCHVVRGSFGQRHTPPRYQPYSRATVKEYIGGAHSSPTSQIYSFI